MKKIPKIYWLFLLVIFVSLGGLFYNYGMVAGGTDEPLKINSSLKFFRDFSLADKNSTFLPVVIILELPFAVLAFVFYLLLGIGDISQFKELAIVDTFKFVPYFRQTTIDFGLLALYIFYKIAGEIFKKQRPAFLAAYFLATSLLFVQQMHIAGAWIVQTMMILISLYYFLALLKKEKWGWGVFIISALLIVFSIEIEVMGLIAAPPLFLIYLQKRKEIKISREFFKILAFFLTLAVGILVFAFLNPVTSSEYFSLAGKPAAIGWGERFLSFWGILLFLEPWLLVLALGGLILLYKKDKFLFIIFSSFLLVYYAVLGPLMGGVAERRLLPVIPALAIPAAFFIDFLLSKCKAGIIKKFLYVLLLIFLINPLLFDRALLKKSSYIEAKNWIIQNIPANTSIWDMCWLELNENKEVLDEIGKNNPELLTTKREYLLSRPYLLESQKGYFVVREDEIAERLGQEKFQYLVVCFFDEERKQKLLNDFETEPKAEIYDSRNGFGDFKAVNLFKLVEFDDLKNSGLKQLIKLPYHGPHFEIYQFF